MLHLFFLSASTIAWSITQKFQMAIPLYRQAQSMSARGVKLERQTLANNLAAVGRKKLAFCEHSSWRGRKSSPLFPRSYGAGEQAEHPCVPALSVGNPAEPAVPESRCSKGVPAVGAGHAGSLCVQAGISVTSGRWAVYHSSKREGYTAFWRVRAEGAAQDQRAVFLRRVIAGANGLPCDE
ncbi:IS66 family transposase [Alkalicoccus chagannorensis]|uniref:IS66 family transposase n=1 Tax=Alkalicoccus chagannorensis TaxID=427072 RepID=UPI00047B7329